LEHDGKLHESAKKRWKAASKELHTDYAAAQLELKIKRQELLDKVPLVPHAPKWPHGSR
jgi:hypothetical protein